MRTVLLCLKSSSRLRTLKTESREVVLDKSIWSNRFIFNHYKSAKENLKTIFLGISANFLSCLCVSCQDKKTIHTSHYFKKHC